MAENPDWVPHGVDTTTPNAARVYDYWLDGAHNFAADRVMADQVQQAMPEIRTPSESTGLSCAELSFS